MSKTIPAPQVINVHGRGEYSPLTALFRVTPVSRKYGRLEILIQNRERKATRLVFDSDLNLGFIPLLRGDRSIDKLIQHVKHQNCIPALAGANRFDFLKKSLTPEGKGA